MVSIVASIELREREAATTDNCVVSKNSKLAKITSNAKLIDHLSVAHKVCLAVFQWPGGHYTAVRMLQSAAPSLGSLLIWVK